MKKYIKLISIIFISIVCFCAFNSNVKAEDELDCNKKLLRCTYKIQKNVDSKDHKYLVDCYITDSGVFECEMHCLENCSNQGYHLKESPNSKMFIPSAGNYSCPSTLLYGWVNNSSDDIYFNVSKGMTTSLYDYCKQQSSQSYSSHQEPEVTVTACGIFGNNYDRISITSAKNNKTGTFTYSAKYIVTPNEYDIINITEAMKKQEIKADGCPLTFKYYLIVSEGNGKYSIIVETPEGEMGSQTMPEYSGWSSYGSGNLSTSFASGHKTKITIENVFNVTNGKITCQGSLHDTLPILKDIFKYVRIGAVLLFIILTGFDFVKAIAESDQSAFKKATGKLGKRVIGLIVILILPTVINLVLAIVQLSNGSCGIS